jgi:ATP-dependent protease ClpP protease subunit
MQFIKPSISTMYQAASMGSFLLAAGERAMFLPPITRVIHQRWAAFVDSFGYRNPCAEILYLKQRLNPCWRSTPTNG